MGQGDEERQSPKAGILVSYRVLASSAVSTTASRR